MLSTHGLWLAAPPITSSFACARTIAGAATIAKTPAPAPLSALRRLILRGAVMSTPFVLCRYTLYPRALPVKRLVRLRVEVVAVELLHVRQQCLRELAPLDLIVGERLLQIVVQRLERAVAIDTGELAVAIDDLAVAHDQFNRFVLGALDHGVEQRRLFIEVWIGELVPIDQHQVGGL